jgi:hypothetical protein
MQGDARLNLVCARLCFAARRILDIYTYVCEGVTCAHACALLHGASSIYTHMCVRE